MTRNDSAEISILGRKLEARSGLKLPHMRAVEFLPWRVATQRRRFERSLSAGDLVVADQHVHSPASKIDPNTVSILEYSEVTADNRFR